MKNTIVLACLFTAAVGCGSDEPGAVAVTDTATGDVTAPSDTAEVDATPGPSEDIETADIAADDVEPTSPDAADAEAPDTSVPWAPAVYSYPECDAKTPLGAAGCVDQATLEGTLKSIVGPRSPGLAHWQETRDICKFTLTTFGFTVETPRSFLGGNVIGTRLGTKYPDQKVVVGARLDSGRNCDAADGNATGVAAALEIARVAAKADHLRTLVISCWDLGEYTRAGSTEHADDLMIAKSDVVVAFALDGLGYTNETPESQTVPITSAQFPDAKKTLDALDYRGVTLWFVGAENTPGPLAALEAGADSVGLPNVSFPLKMDWLNNETFFDYRRSDHAAFWDRGIPAVWVTDSGSQRNPNFRCRQGTKDSLDTLDLDFYRAATATTASAVVAALDAEDPGTTASLHVPECDVVTQDCPAGKRCVYLRAADDSEKRACVDAAAAPKAAGESCARPNDVLGEDDCDKGLFCSFYGGTWTNADTANAQFDRKCSRYCRFTKDCAEGELCVGIGSSDVERTGLCRPSCLVLSGDCGEGQKCMPASLTHGSAQGPACMPAGPTQDAAPCTDASQCGVDLMCLPLADGSAAACRPLCSDEKACATGFSCFTPRGIIVDLTPAPDGTTDVAPGFGYCFDDAAP